MNKNILLPDDRIFTISDLLTDAECAEYIALSEGIGYQDAPITTYQGFVMRKDVRNNDRVILDSTELAAQLWPKLAPFIPAEIEGWHVKGLNERFRFYRYQPGQFFALHYDGCYRVSSSEESKLTLMIYLNGGCQGGATRFELKYMSQYPQGEIIVSPTKGMALCFDHYIMHEGCPIEQGQKYVLRTDVMYIKPTT